MDPSSVENKDEDVLLQEAFEEVQIISTEEESSTTKSPRLRGPKRDNSQVTSSVKMEEDQIVLAYKSICNFVKALNEVFGDGFPSLQLYSHLLEKTGLIHEDPIKKHIGLFRKWIKDNESLILTKNYKNAKELGHLIQPIQYSEKVFVDMKGILEQADEEQLTIIHTHLLTIAAIVDPSSEAKRLLREEKNRQRRASTTKEGNGNGEDDDVFSNIFKKIGSSVNMDSGNPLEMVSSVLQSGVIQDVMTAVNEGFTDDTGNMDFGKMLGSVQKLFSTMQTQQQPPPPSSS